MRPEETHVEVGRQRAVEVKSDIEDEDGVKTQMEQAVKGVLRLQKKGRDEGFGERILRL